MTRPLTELIAEVLARPEEDRHDLADALCESLEPDDKTDEDWPLGPGWAAEIARRVAEIEAGNAKGIPWEEVKRRMEADDAADEEFDDAD